MSHAKYPRREGRDRRVYQLQDVPEDIAEGVRAARVPAEAAAFDHEVDS